MNYFLLTRENFIFISKCTIKYLTKLAKISFSIQWCDMKTVYLDYASTAPRNPLVIQAREAFELSHYANVGRGLYTLAEEALEYYHNSKKNSGSVGRL